MPRYKEQVISAKTYTRCSNIDVRFPLVGDPTLGVHEEEVTEVNGSITSVRGLGFMQLPVTDDNTEFVMLDKNGDPTANTMTFARLYRALESAYADLAARRDAVPPPAEEPI